MPKANGTSETARRLGISRQRVWAIWRQAEGRCLICGKPRINWGHCRKHADMENERAKKRYHLKKAKERA